MNAYEAVVESYLTRGRLTAVQLFLQEVNKIMSTPYKREKRAHTVPRTWMIWKGDKRVPYRSILHYAPEIGYWIVLKDAHGNIMLNSPAYLLASTCRLVLTEKLYELRGGQDDN